MNALAAARARVRPDLAGGAALGLLLLAIYAPVLRALAGVWADTPYYSYGVLVPLFSAALAWDARHALAGRPPARSRAGAGVLAAGLGLLLAGTLAGSLTVQVLSIPLVATGAVLGTLGRARARVLAFPLGFLALMAPLPDGALPAMSLPLQHAAAVAGEWMLWLIGTPVKRAGLYLALPSVTLHITEACNGLRFLLAMVVIGVACAGTVPAGRRRRLAMLGAAVGLALVSNWVRVAGTGVLAETWGHQAATGLPHVIWGKVVYALALVPFGALVLALRRRS